MALFYWTIRTNIFVVGFLILAKIPGGRFFHNLEPIFYETDDAKQPFYDFSSSFQGRNYQYDKFSPHSQFPFQAHPSFVDALTHSSNPKLLQNHQRIGTGIASIRKFYSDLRNRVSAHRSNPWYKMGSSNNRGRSKTEPSKDSKWSVEWIKSGKIGKIDLGICTSVALDKQGFLYVLHRGNRTWNANTFDGSYVFNNKDQVGPIKEHVLLKLDPKNGKIVDKYFANRFYMPHSLTIDADDNFWIVDVAMHQVYKYAKGRFKKPVLVLGTKFEPGQDYQHFCQPTDVTVSAITGQFFIADGYCNNRIMKYDANGNLISVFGRSEWRWLVSEVPNFLLVPHSLTLIERLDLVCVADREHYRILCLRAGTLQVFDDQDIFRSYNYPNVKRNLPRLEYEVVDVNGIRYKPYAVYYCPKNDKIYVAAQSSVGPYVAFAGKISVADNIIKIDSWQQFPKNSKIHDLVVGDNYDLKTSSKHVYFADLNNQIWKFNETQL